MPDPTDPRAVADDPSGIVQQMPESDLAELRASIPSGPWTAHRNHPLNACTHVCAGEWNSEVATLYGCFDDVSHPDEGQPWPDHPIREATARAIALLPDLMDEVIASRATEADLRAEVERLREALIKINVGNGWAALIARAALSPETDGDQDG